MNIPENFQLRSVLALSSSFLRSHSLSASVPVCDGCANAGTSSRHRVASPLRFGWLNSICLSSTCDFDMYPRPSKGQVKPGLESKDQVKLGRGSAGYLQHQKLMLDHMASWKIWMDYKSASPRHHHGSQAGHLFSVTERTHFTYNRQIDIRTGRWNLDGDNSMIYLYYIYIYY